MSSGKWRPSCLSLNVLNGYDIIWQAISASVSCGQFSGSAEVCIIRISLAMDLLPDTQNCGLRMPQECRERFPRRRIQRKQLVSDPGRHHGTCVTHVPWCMSGSLTRDGGEIVPGILGACATRNFAYLVRGPWLPTNQTREPSIRRNLNFVLFILLGISTVDPVQLQSLSTATVSISGDESV